MLFLIASTIPYSLLGPSRSDCTAPISYCQALPLSTVIHLHFFASFDPAFPPSCTNSLIHLFLQFVDWPDLKKPAILEQLFHQVLKNFSSYILGEHSYKQSTQALVASKEVILGSTLNTYSDVIFLQRDLDQHHNG